MLQETNVLKTFRLMILPSDVCPDFVEYQQTFLWQPIFYGNLFYIVAAVGEVESPLQIFAWRQIKSAKASEAALSTRERQIKSAKRQIKSGKRQIKSGKPSEVALSKNRLKSRSSHSEAINSSKAV